MDTLKQQFYFFAYVIGIVVNMRCIDIEFANQPVVLPLATNDPIKNKIEELIHLEDVRREQAASSMTSFQGFVIPPPNAWNEGEEQQSSNTAVILNKIDLITHNAVNEVVMEEIYVQNSKFVTATFNRSQAEFLRLIECVRLSVIITLPSLV